MEPSGAKVRMESITKTFPGVIANDSITIEFMAGEVHALLGENGAGKTTLMNVLYGLHRPDAGTIYVDNVARVIDGPGAAIALGIGMVHQHFMLVPPFTVAENIVLGMEPRDRWGRVDMKRAVRRVMELSDVYGLKVDANAKVETISVGMQQRVEILKALYRGAEVLILDEPTAVLTPQEVLELKHITDGLVAQGKAVVIITHKLKEVLSMARRVTVIRRGRTVGSFACAETGLEELARAMVGRDVVLDISKAECHPGEPILEVKGLSATSSRGLKALRDVSLTVRAGEIMGVAGVEGNGQTELIEVIAGLRKASGGSVKVHGAELCGKPARGVGAAGVAHIPEDRQRRGLVLDFSVAENAVLDMYHKAPFSHGISLNAGAIGSFGRGLVERFDVRTPSEQVAAKTLSGGNQQKVVIGRELSREPEVVLAAQPTRGLDVGAIEFVHRRLLDARDAGKAVLLVSLELDEILALADRIAVMYEGRVVAVLEASEATEELLGLYMAGAGPAGANLAGEARL